MELSIEKNLMVPMRDGIKLASDIYRPADGERYPVVMLRLPYNKEQPMILFLSGDILRIAQAGYAVVVQDCRGTFQSEGEFSPFFQEINDGEDAIAWAAAQSWSNGAVGMMGASYYGATQWLAAMAKPPALKTIAPFITTDQYYENWTYQGGAFQLGFILQWASGTFALGELARRVSHNEADGAALAQGIDAANAVAERYWHLPTSELAELEDLTPYVKDWIAHPDYDDYWREIAPSECVDELALPALNFGGWYDLFLGGTLRNYVALKDKAPQKLVIGPWAHGYNGGVYAESDFGMMANDGVTDVTAEQIRWFDRWLKNASAPRQSELPVKLFIMGINQWREEIDWPLPDSKWKNCYLHSDGRADINGGTLSFDPPATEPADAYTYDPADPVPSCGGATFLPGLFIAANAGPRDQSSVSKRADVLTYSSEILTVDTEITGPISLKLYVRSSVCDTDFTGKLVDLYPDGRAMILTDGILRARYRNGFDVPESMRPGEVYLLEIDLIATANVFRAGHRIQLEVSSSNFPRFDRNSNCGGVIADATKNDFLVAHNEVLHDNEHPSHLVLPFIERR